MLFALLGTDKESVDNSKQCLVCVLECSGRRYSAVLTASDTEIVSAVAVLLTLRRIFVRPNELGVEYLLRVEKR